MFNTWWAVAPDLLIKGTLVLAAACALSSLALRASAAARHAIWTLALGSLLLLPVLEGVLPSWQPPHLSRGAISISEAIAIASANEPGPPKGSPRTRLPQRAAIAALAVWMAGALVCLWRWRNGASQVARLRRLATPIADARITALVAELTGLLRLRRPVHALIGHHEMMPMAAGIRQPAILLPASASQWSPERLRVVLLHELAHIRRKDCLSQALAETVLCLYWFHPLAWLAARRLRVERERACDDLVLGAGHKASDYAAHLLELAQSLPAPAFSHAAMTVARPSHLESRLRAILNPQLNRRALTPRVSVAACLAAACLVLPLAAMRPQANNARTITGTVYDAEGARIPYAKVIAINTQSGDKEFAMTDTDEEGRFSVGPLKDGPWRVGISAPGFAAATRNVQKPDGSHFDITLQLGDVQETVFVRGKGSPAPPATGPRRVRVGGNVTPAKLVHRVNPEYPESVRSRGIQGDVVLRAVILMDGSPSSLKVISSPDAELSQAATEAVRQWRYETSLLNGKPVETVTTITVNFQLEP